MADYVTLRGAEMQIPAAWIELPVLTDKTKHLWRPDGYDKWVEQGNRIR